MMSRQVLRPLLGLGAIVLVATIVTVAVTMFRGGFADTTEVTVRSPRAGLVMDPDAKVEMRGVLVGRVSSIEELPDGTAQLRLAMSSGALHRIPSNVTVDVAATTVFGAKYVDLVPPPDPSPMPMYAGQVVDAEQVTVEINTVFEQLVSVLSKIEPDKLNQTLGAIAEATRGRGHEVGEMLTGLDRFLAALDPAMPALRNDLSLAPGVMDTYAQTAPDLLDTVHNSTQISNTVVDESQHLDALLVSLIGLSDIGTQVLGDNHGALATTLDLLVPTTALTNKYNPALTCALGGLAWLNGQPTPGVNGAALSVNFLWGMQPYKYPKDLPKVAAKGGPQCLGLPRIPYAGHPPYVVTDTGTNPFANGSPVVTPNFAGIAELLFGGIPTAAPFGVPR